MTITKELLLAILSMDSYNRGYGAGLEVTGTSVGTATVLTDSTEKLGLQVTKDAGFYAAVYTLSSAVDDLAANSTVIAYRGTDNFIANGTQGGSDILQGWISGAGVPFSQTSLALGFYESVTNSTCEQGPQSNVILTGRSLGGDGNGAPQVVNENFIHFRGHAA